MTAVDTVMLINVTYLKQCVLKMPLSLRYVRATAQNIMFRDLLCYYEKCKNIFGSL